jgi:hypothetical protein
MQIQINIHIHYYSKRTYVIIEVIRILFYHLNEKV